MNYKNIFFLVIFSLVLGSISAQSKVKSKGQKSNSKIVRFVPPKIVAIKEINGDEIKTIEELGPPPPPPPPPPQISTIVEEEMIGHTQITEDSSGPISDINEVVDKHSTISNKYYTKVFSDKSNLKERIHPYYNETSIGNFKILRDDQSRYGIVNYSDEVVLPFVYSNIGRINDNNIYIRISEKTALYNLEKGFVTSYKYNNLSQIVNMLEASVTNPKSFINEYGIIDFDDNIILPFEYDNITAINHQELLDLVILNKTGKFGLYSIFQKKWILPMLYKSLYQDNTTNYLTATTDSTAILFDVKGNKIIKNKKLQSLSIENGEYIIYQENGKYGVMDFEQIQIIPTLYKSLSLWNGLYFSAQNDSNKVGYLNLDGSIALPFEYDAVNYLNEGNYVAKKNSKCGLVNISKNGIKEIMVCDYDTISQFNETKVIVTKKGKFGILANTGKIIVPLSYDSLYLLEFIDRSYDRYIRHYIVVYNRMGKYGIMDYNTGKELSENIYDKITINDKILVCTKNNKLGLANVYGSEILPCEFDNLLSMNSNLIQIEKNHKFGLVEMGAVHKTIIPIEYDAINFSQDNKVIYAYKNKTTDKYYKKESNWIRK